MASSTSSQQPTLRRIREIERGLPFRRIEKLISALNETDARIAYLVQIAPRTLVRRKHEGTLKPDESERVDRIERIYHLAIELFEGDKTEAVKWLKEPNRGLANQSRALLESDVIRCLVSRASGSDASRPNAIHQRLAKPRTWVFGYYEESSSS